MADLLKIRRAILSVWNKQGLEFLAHGLTKYNVEILSTGGTEKVLRKAGVPVTPVSEVTGFPEILNGRVKTLHPKILGGILARKDDDSQMREIEELGILPIDLVVVNLYPFEQVVAGGAVELAEALEQIDIGGPTMIRAAAKNFPSVAVVVDPQDYQTVLTELEENDGAITYETRRRLAAKVFSRTAQYDQAIAHHLWSEDGQWPPALAITLMRQHQLRYGENPHQSAAFYISEPRRGFGQLEQLHGKELSFNNLMDTDAAVGVVSEFDEPAVCIVKHSNPCGVGVGETCSQAYDKALATDPVSAFGGIVACNREVDSELAEKLYSLFLEVIVAPSFSADALKKLTRKKNLRLLTMPFGQKRHKGDLDMKSIWGGWLVQEFDSSAEGDFENARVVTKRVPTEEEWQALRFAWKVSRWVKSNAIVFAGQDRTLGIGAGQMSRVDAVHLAAWKARNARLSLSGSVVASDAFFPFRDGVDAAAKAGATAIVQPGGSIRDEEVIQAANEHNMAMVFTGIRHFRH